MSPQNSAPRSRPASFLQQLGMAMELPFVLVGWVLAAGACGYFLDRWLRLSPLLTLAGGALGLGLALRDILKRLSRAERKQGDGRK